jgi:putative phosphoribosyl transferase
MGSKNRIAQILRQESKPTLDQTRRLVQISGRMGMSVASNALSKSCKLNACLETPVYPKGTVIFVHGLGSGRSNPRNCEIASDIRARGFATLLVDLLNENEANELKNFLDPHVMSARVLSCVEWCLSEPALRDLPVGLFGMSHGADAALQIAAEKRDLIAAIVLRNGRPDAAIKILKTVRSPTLFIVDQADQAIAPENFAAFSMMTCKKKMITVKAPASVELQARPLELIASHAASWFESYLKHSTRRSAPTLGARGTLWTT